MLHSDRVTGRLEVIRVLRTRGNIPWGDPWSDAQAEAEISEAMRGAVNDRDPGVHIEAITLAAERGWATTAQVRELLHDTDCSRVRIALQAVRSLGDDAAQLLPDVLTLLDGQAAAFEEPRGGLPANLQHFHLVLSALSSIKEGASPAIGRLLEISKDHRDDSCIMIATTLHAIGAAEGEIAGVLTPLILGDDRRLIWHAGDSMVKFCPEEARRRVSLLLPNLGSAATKVDKEVLFAIYSLGAQAQEAVPALVPLLHSREPWVAEFAAHALGAAGPVSAQCVPSLMEVIGDDSVPVAQRLACISALQSIGPDVHNVAQNVVADLLAVLCRPDPKSAVSKEIGRNTEWDVRAAIVGVLGQLGETDAELVPVLRSKLSSRSPALRAAAAEALGRIARQSPDALNDLIRRLRDEDATVRAAASSAIGQMDCDHSRAIDVLGDALFDEDIRVSTAAAISLGKIGPPARSALPALRERLAEPRQPFPVYQLQQALRGAIGEIEPDAAGAASVKKE
jgi:HEAT repeat protein